MSEEHKLFVKKNSYVPYILPEWKNQCNSSDKPDQQESQIIQLTDENASNYSEITSHVGWKRRVNYALNHIEANNNNNNHQDSSILACLLENVISTVIVLASEQETLPDEYLINTYLFLRNIHNEFGENPPNIAAFMEFLKTKASEEVLSIMKSIANSEIQKLPSNLIITRIPKNLQTKMSKK